MEILLLGGESCGKSTLMNKLLDSSSNNTNNTIANINNDINNLSSYFLIDPIDDIKSIQYHNQQMCTIPTIGMERCELQLQKYQRIILRELGTSLIHKISSYLDNCLGIIFIFDMSDLSSISDSFIFLLEVIQSIISSEIKKYFHITIVYNKTDLLFDEVPINSIHNALGIQHIVDNKPENIFIREVYGNCMDNVLVDDLIPWIENICKNS